MLTEHEPKLEKVWPEVALRLTRTLRRRGVSPEDAEDAVQETAVRAIRYEVPFSDADHLLRWSNTVAWRIVLNRRRDGRRQDPQPVPDVASTELVADRALDRYVLDEVAARLADLKPADRAALAMTTEGADRTRTDAMRAYVRRHRARIRLKAMLDGLVGWLGWLALRRRLRARTAVAVATAVPIVAIAVLTLPQWRDDRSAPGPRVLTTRAPGGPSGPAPTVIASQGPPATAPVSPPPRDDVGRAPYVEVELPLDRRVGVRPKEEEDHLACWDTIVLGVRCVKEPPAVKELFSGRY